MSGFQIEDQNQDQDSNSYHNSNRFRRLMRTNSVALKSSTRTRTCSGSRWFSDRIQPWVHYVPIQADFSDMYDALFFFRGDPMGFGSHDDLAKQIALAGEEWSRTFWREEDVKAYLFR